MSIARLKEGDIGGLAGLVETYQLQAVRPAYLIVRDRPLAEDITQSAFIRSRDSGPTARRSTRSEPIPPPTC